MASTTSTSSPEARIIAVLDGADLPRLQAVIGPDPRHRGLAPRQVVRKVRPISKLGSAGAGDAEVDVDGPAPGQRLAGPHLIELLPAAPGMGAELADAVDAFDVTPFVA